MARKPYRSKVKIGVGQHGQPINKWIQGRTKAELSAARQAVIEKYVTGKALAEDRQFGDYAAEWYRVRKAPFVSPSSRDSYRTALNHDIFPVFGNHKLRSISSMQLQEFLNSFAGKSATKITILLATLRGVFKCALSDRMIDTDPTLSLQRPKAAPPKEKPVLTPEQRKALEQTCLTHPGGHYLALMYYLGVRPGEARGLMWKDIDWKESLVHIRRDIDYKDHAAPGELKTKASARTIPLPDRLRAILSPLRGLPGTYIAHGDKAATAPLSKSSAERLWTDLMIAANLAEPAEDNRYGQYDPRRLWRALITPHTLRHNYITICWEHGLDPYETMALVGHTSIKTTMDIYTHLSDAQRAKTAAKLNQIFPCNFYATFFQTPKKADARKAP